MEVEIKYFNKGKEIIKKVDINIISAWVLMKRDELIKDIFAFTELKERSLNVLKESGDIAKEKSAGWEELIAEKKNELIQITEEMKSYADNGFFEKRFAIIKEILEVNGVEDEELLNMDTWERRMNPEDLYTFFNAAFSKGEEPKKKE